jgi:hypothetical protein
VPITAFSSFTDGLDAPQRDRGHFVANLDVDDQRRWVLCARGLLCVHSARSEAADGRSS